MSSLSTPELARLPAKLCSLLIVYNGTLAGGEGASAAIGGGDQVILKFIRLSGFKPDLIVPRSAVRLVQPHGELFLTMRNLGPGLLAMLWLYLVRTIQGIVCAWRTRRAYDIALGVSAIAVDLLPLWCARARRRGVIIYHLLPERKAVNVQTRLRFFLAACEHKVAMRLVGAVCDFVVAGNHHTQGQLEGMFPRKRVVVLHAGFDAAAIDQTSEETRDPKLACFMGRLTSQKGIFDLVTVMERICAVEPDFRLVLIGEGPDRDALQALLRQKKLGSVELKGFVSDREKYQWLRRSSFFFFPSYEEGWGIALAEALYCKATCICYELPHYRAIFGDYPVYVRLGDAGHFVEMFWKHRHRIVSPSQKGFVRQYHDPEVVRSLVEHLAGFGVDSQV